MNIKSLAVKGIKFWNKHDRTILKGVSIASSLLAVAFAWNARPKCEKALEELNARNASNVEKAKTLGKIVGPMIVAEAVSVGSSLFEYKKTGEKLAGMVNAVSTYKALSEIRKEAEKENLPEEKVKEIDDAIVKKRLETASSEEIETTGHGDTLFIEPTYTGKVWRGSKDYWDLCVEKCNSKLFACYDKYGILKKDEFAISFWDIFRELKLRTYDMLFMLEFPARDFKELPVMLEPVEFTEKDGSTSLGYKVVFTHRPSIAYSDLVEG